MKQIITDKAPNIIHIQSIIGIDLETKGNIVAYEQQLSPASRTDPKYAYCILTRLGSKLYGFISLNHPVGARPTYVRPCPNECIEAAAKERNAYLFENIGELINFLR